MSFSISRWYKQLPPRDKQSLLTLLVFAVILAFFVTLTVTEHNYNDDIKKTTVFPGFIVKLGRLATVISSEAETAVRFSLKHTDGVLYDEMRKAQAATDEVYKEAFTYVQEQKHLHTWDSNELLAYGGTFMTEQGLGPLKMLRSQMSFGEVVLDSQSTRRRYLDIINRLSGLMGTCAIVFDEDIDYSALVVANAFMSVVNSFQSVEYHTQLYQLYSKEETASPTPSEKVVAQFKAVLVSLLTYQSLSTLVLKPLLYMSDLTTMNAKVATFDVDEIIHTFLAESTKQQFFPEDLAIAGRNSLPEIRKTMNALADSNDAHREGVYKASFSNQYYWYLTCSCLCGAAFLVALAEFLWLRLFEAKGSALKRSNAVVMHDVLVRVSEYVNEIATFSLSPKPPPLTMADRKVSIVEMEMMYLLGTIKTTAPTLPPLLFPDHLRSLAAEFSDVKDPATMVLAPPPRINLQNKKMHVQTTEDPHPYLQSLAEKTDLQEHICEAAFMFVSLTAFHDLGSAEKRKFASEYYQRVVSIIEECVFQHGGIMHSVSFDKAVAVWNVKVTSDDEQSGDAYGTKRGFCELAATCGLTLANRLNILRAQKPLVRENFPLHIGIVGGTVDAGVFGSEAAKTIAVFGPPILRGMLVAQANGFHTTSVACDDYICKAIQRVYFCKPIELLPCGGCAYQVLNESAHDESDLEMQLLTYTKAFELFERKHYKGALKAFRAYTKQYGYDSSVERIQFLITSTQP